VFLTDLLGLVSHGFACVSFSQICTDYFHRFELICVLRTDFLRFVCVSFSQICTDYFHRFALISVLRTGFLRLDLFLTDLRVLVSHRFALIIFTDLH
jgi:hypothetical protein